MSDSTLPLPADPDADERHASLGAPELFRLLVRLEDFVPRAIIDECAGRGDAMIDEIEKLLETEYYWGDDITEGEWWLPLHAAMILGLMRHERAGRLLTQYLQRIGDNDTLVEWLSGYWPALFRNKPTTVVPLLRALGEDRSQGWLVRVDAVEATIAHAEAHGADASSDALAGGGSGQQFRRVRSRGRLRHSPRGCRPE